MISYPLMKRLGMTAGGLVPFFKCVIVYFVVVRELAPSLTVAAGKCAPVLCLMLFALLHPPPPHVRDQGWYASCVATGLALSMVGDALLVWPECFEAGMGAFALAHLAYLAGLGFRPLALHLAVACHCATAAFLLLLELPGRLAWLVPLYAALLASTAWRGAARGGRAALGALLFLASDGLLAYGMFGGPMRHNQLWVMSTYYMAQMALALSVLDPTPED